MSYCDAASQNRRIAKSSWRFAAYLAGFRPSGARITSISLIIAPACPDLAMTRHGQDKGLRNRCVLDSGLQNNTVWLSGTGGFVLQAQPLTIYRMNPGGVDPWVSNPCSVLKSRVSASQDSNVRTQKYVMSIPSTLTRFVGLSLLRRMVETAGATISPELETRNQGRIGSTALVMLT